MKYPIALCVLTAVLAVLGVSLGVAPGGAAAAPPAASAAASGGRGAARFDAAGKLVFPADYRHWTYLTSGFGMSYNPAASDGAHPAFDSVFVDPASEAAFRRTGHWPEGTVMVLEIRGSNDKGSINLHGAYQAGAPVAIELHVRDSKRFSGDGWGFFSTMPTQQTALLPTTATCYGCHHAHAAVDTTFVQFYPTLLPIATAHATLSAAYQADEHR